MSITIRKPILKGMDREHLQLLDPSCGATETPTHFSLRTPLTGCSTKRRHTKAAIVYSNKVLEIPLKQSDIITRVREIEIPFSCYYSNYRDATAVGMKPKNRKLVFSEKGQGNFTVVLELFHCERFDIKVRLDLGHGEHNALQSIFHLQKLVILYNLKFVSFRYIISVS